MLKNVFLSFKTFLNNLNLNKNQNLANNFDEHCFSMLWHYQEQIRWAS